MYRFGRVGLEKTKMDHKKKWFYLCIFITGDLDFYTPEIQENFTLMTPGDFLNAFFRDN